MGRGLVHPLDLDHPANPPSHPELLDLLADELAAHKFDVRGFLRELALSQTYQRSSELPRGRQGRAAADASPLRSLKPLSPEQLAWSLMQATGLTDAERKALGQGRPRRPCTPAWPATSAPFVATFGSQPGQPEARASRPRSIRRCSWPTARCARLAGAAAGQPDRPAGALKDSDAVAEELYLSVLTRPPTRRGTQGGRRLPGRPAGGPRRRPCRTWPGRCWRRRSFASIIEPAREHAELQGGIDHALLLRLRLAGTRCSRGAASSPA